MAFTHLRAAYENCFDNMRLEPEEWLHLSDDERLARELFEAYLKLPFSLHGYDEAALSKYVLLVLKINALYPFAAVHPQEWEDESDCKLRFLRDEKGRKKAEIDYKILDRYSALKGFFDSLGRPGFERVPVPEKIKPDTWTTGLFLGHALHDAFFMVTTADLGFEAKRDEKCYNEIVDRINAKHPGFAKYVDDWSIGEQHIENRLFNL